jgi:serine kinase of HPr protein (carbohydrate metabolism regulator)
MTQLSSERIHASSVAIGGKAVLICGRSGFGKSDLALRLVDRGATLVSDDYTLVQRKESVLLASPPSQIKGKIEVRGIGIVDFPFVEVVPVGLMVVIDEPVARLPEGPETRRIVGVEIPVITLPGLEASSPIKVELALRALNPK